MDLVTASTMPIALSIGDLAYERRVEQGTLGKLVSGQACPICANPVELTNRRRRRKRVRLVAGRCVAGDFVVLLAGCGRGHLSRVLPANLQPRKVYSVEAQEAAIRGYLEGREGLRIAVRRLGHDAPHFTTLHGWLGGLGDFALGLETPSGSSPASALLEETKRRYLPDLDLRWRANVEVASWQYRSEARRELLEGATRLLDLTTAALTALSMTTTLALAEWVRLALSWPLVTTISWWARKRGTAIQPRRLDSDVDFQHAHMESAPCLPSSRSPPSDSK